MSTVNWCCGFRLDLTQSQGFSSRHDCRDVPVQRKTRSLSQRHKTNLDTASETEPRSLIPQWLPGSKITWTFHVVGPIDSHPLFHCWQKPKHCNSNQIKMTSCFSLFTATLFFQITFAYCQSRGNSFDTWSQLWGDVVRRLGWRQLNSSCEDRKFSLVSPTDVRGPRQCPTSFLVLSKRLTASALNFSHESKVWVRQRRQCEMTCCQEK